MTAFRGILVIAAALGLCGAGCRLPRPYLSSSYFQERVPHFEYDTRHPEALPPERAHYQQALAEPVMLVNWEEEVASTWQVLYATNRRPQPVSQPRRVVFGNEITTSPEYGVCAVTLPERERGQEEPTPAKDSNLPDWMQAIGFRAKHDAEVVVQEHLTTIERVQPLPTEDFFSHLHRLMSRSPQNDVLLFIHGFNVSYDEAVKRATQLAADLPFNGAVVVYSWPSQGGLDNYERDGEVVKESLPAFREFLLEFCRRIPTDAKINIVAHSMGNRLVQEALWHLPDEYTQPPRITELVFAAPDVGIEEFRRNVRQAVKVSERVTLYQCTNDSALIASMFKNKEERAGSPNAAVLVKGMDTIETAAVDVSLLGHSYYGSNTTVLRDLFAVVKEHTPVEQRPWLWSIPFQSVPLWNFRGQAEQLVWKWHFEKPAGDHEM